MNIKYKRLHNLTLYKHEPLFSLFKNMLNKAQHKTRLTQGTRKQNTQVIYKSKEEDREKVTKSL